MDRKRDRHYFIDPSGYHRGSNNNSSNIIKDKWFE